MEPKYVVQTDFNLEEYEKYVKAMMGRRKTGQIIEKALIVIILAVAVLELVAGNYVMAALQAFVAVGVPLIFRFVNRKQIEKTYDRIRKIQGNVFTISFYEDHFESRNQATQSSIEYSRICGVIETETNFYLLIMPNQGFIVQKKNCSYELLDFIRNMKK